MVFPTLQSNICIVRTSVCSLKHGQMASLALFPNVANGAFRRIVIGRAQGLFWTAFIKPSKRVDVLITSSTRVDVLIRPDIKFAHAMASC